MRNTTFLLSVFLLVAACGPGPDNGSEGPNLSFDAAQARAATLGTLMIDEIAAVQVELQTGLEQELPHQEALAIALADIFSGESSVIVLENHDVLVDDAFTIRPESMDGNPGTVYSAGNRPSILIWSLTGDTGFFYEPTIWDMSTGNLYQGMVLESMEDASAWRFFGPWSPPLNARVTGSFDADQRFELYNAIRSGLFDAS